jgi:hypothetical protein
MKQQFGDGLPPGSDVYMNRKSLYLNTDLFITWITQHFPKHKDSEKVILLIDCNRAYCSYTLLLHTAVANNGTIIRLPNHYTHTLQSLDKYFFGPLKSHFKNKAASCKRTRYRMSRHMGFDWSKVVSVSVGVNAFE